MPFFLFEADKRLIRKRVLLIAPGLILLFFALPLLWGRNNLPPRVMFGNENLRGGFADIEKSINRIAGLFEQKSVGVNFQSKKINTTFSETGLKIDREGTVRNLNAALGGSDGSVLKHALKWWSSLLWGYKAQAYYAFDLSKTEKLTGNKFNVVLTPSQEASVSVTSDNISVIPAKEGVGIDGMAVVAQILRNLKEWDSADIHIKVAKVDPEISTSEAEKLKQNIEDIINYPFVIQARPQEGGGQAVSSNFNLTRETVLSWIEIQKKENPEIISLDSTDSLNFMVNAAVAGQSFSESKIGYHLEWETDKNKIRNFVDQQVQKAIYRAPANGQLAFEDGVIRESAPSQSEIATDIDASTEKIAQALKKSEYFIVLPINENPAPLSLQNVKKLGLDTLVGKGESNFTGSPKNRKHNIGVGASKFNGVVIPQGEEFSFLKTLGPVDKSTGYLPELVIKADKTVPEYGGGMCQVSTTCFRAEINTGLRTTERQNHAYPVQYYSPQGTDATVYIPHPDLKFMNDTPAPILIQTRIVGNILAFEFFGKSDGRTVALEGPRYWDKKSDGSMKAEWIQKVYDRDGKLMFQKNFLSKYDSPSKYPHPGDEKPPAEEKKKKKKKGGT